jgi:hypothetical protein
MPILFAENSITFPPYSNYVNIYQAPLNDCNNTNLSKAIEAFLQSYFKNVLIASFQQVDLAFYIKKTILVL